MALLLLPLRRALPMLLLVLALACVSDVGGVRQPVLQASSATWQATLGPALASVGDRLAETVEQTGTGPAAGAPASAVAR